MDWDFFFEGLPAVDHDGVNVFRIGAFEHETGRLCRDRHIERVRLSAVGNAAQDTVGYVKFLAAQISAVCIALDAGVAVGEPVPASPAQNRHRIEQGHLLLPDHNVVTLLPGRAEARGCGCYRRAAGA